MIKPLLLKEIKANYKILIIFILIITMYGGIIVAMFDPELGKSLEMMAQSMPELFAAFSMSNAGTTLIEFVTNYLFGFIMIVIPFIFTLIMINRLLVRYNDNGSLAYLLASYHSRKQIVLTQLFTAMLGILILIIYEIILVIVCGKLLFDQFICLDQFLILNLGLLALQLFFLGIVYLGGCLFRETRLASGVSGGIIVIFILIQMLGQVSDKITFLKYLTPLSLFDTTGLINLETKAIIMVIILFLLAFILIILGTKIFEKRDLSL